MATTKFSGVLPSLNQKEDDFAPLAEAWIRWFTLTAVFDIDSAIDEIVALANIVPYDDEDPYQWPDSVIYTDGITYRCTSQTPVTGEDPSLLVNFVRLTISEVPRLSVPDGAMLTGGIIGGAYRKTGANQVQFDATACYDGESNNIAISCSQQYITVGSAINTVYNLFACSDGVIRADVDEYGSGLSAYVTRYVGFVPTDSSGEIMPFVVVGDYIIFTDPSKPVIATITTTYAQYDASHLVPLSRVASVVYGFNGGVANCYVSVDGVNQADGGNSSAGTISYFDILYAPAGMPLPVDAYLKATSGVSALIVSAKIRR